MARRRERIIVCIKRQRHRFEDIAVLEDVVEVPVGTHIADGLAIFEPEGVTVRQVLPGIIVGLGSIDVMTLDIWEVLSSLVEVIKIVKRVKSVCNWQSPRTNHEGTPIALRTDQGSVAVQLSISQTGHTTGFRLSVLFNRLVTKMS